MNFVTQPDIGNLFLKELSDATTACIAVAYFKPDALVAAALHAISNLTVIVSEEFTINDPYELESLSQSATVRSVACDSENGKLHAKVLLVQRRDRSSWALVGSANVTWQGLFSNQEACLTLDSRFPADKELVEQVAKWFVSLLDHARTPDFEQAKAIYNSRSLLRLERRPTKQLPDQSSTQYWALKTTSGFTGEEFWPHFVSEGVIAIGWPGINVNPAVASDVELRSAVVSAHPQEGDPSGAARKLKKFVNLAIDDIVLICKGYPPNSSKPVHIYGFARVVGAFRDDRSSTWSWRFKHDAVIQVIDLYLPKEVAAEALGKGSLRGTIHELDRLGFERLANRLGVAIEV